MAQIIAGADAESNSTSASPVTPSSITTAIRQLEANGYNATDFVIHPNVAEDIRNTDTFVEADKAGVTNPSESLIGRIYGMNVWRTTNGTSSGSTYYGMVIDRQHALCLAEKRPITVERYNDVTRDLSGIAVTARWHARYLRSKACAYISTT